jgi:hypothetical protein
VVSYTLYPYQGSRISQDEWRIFDPARNRDELFLTLPGGFGGVRWDTTFTSAYFLSGDSLCLVEWKWGATPRVVTRLPAGVQAADWWFNPDSSCWQAVRILWQSEADHDYYSTYFGELWQCSRDGARWRRVRADTLDCADLHCTQWNARNGPLGRRLSMILWDDLERRAQNGLEDGEAVGLDTAAVRLFENEDNPGDWYFMPSKRSARRGVGFRLSRAEVTQVSGPYFVVDLDHRTKRLLQTGHDDSEAWTGRCFSEQCGLLLVPGTTGNPVIVDTGTGALVFSQTWNAEGAVWLRGPRGPASRH